MDFALRNGFREEEEQILINSMSEKLRTRLYNQFLLILDMLDSTFHKNTMQYIGDKLGFYIGDYQTCLTKVYQYFLTGNDDSEWYSPYIVFELLFQYLRDSIGCESCDQKVSAEYCKDSEIMKTLPNMVNTVLKEERSGYRLVDWVFTPITESVEVKAIENGMSSGVLSARIHLKKALERYSDRKSPDYENSIKESISAVEAMCCYITGISGRQASLGKTIKKLKDHGVHIHKSMETAFNSLYGYTSDETGIRHGGIEFHHASAEDAQFMLVACSAFVSYLAEKVLIIDEATHGQDN